MGTYTSFRGIVKVKTSYLEIADKISTYELSEQENPFVNEFLKTFGSVSIPNNNELQSVFRSEETFFNNRLEKDILYFRADLKNYIDHNTGLTPIESFVKNILEHIVDEIFLLEINSENYTSVEQYAFSNEREPKIKRVNITNYENEDYRSLVPPTEPQKNDYFQEFKEANNLQVFESPE